MYAIVHTNLNVRMEELQKTTTSKLYNPFEKLENELANERQR